MRIRSLHLKLMSKASSQFLNQSAFTISRFKLKQKPKTMVLQKSQSLWHLTLYLTGRMLRKEKESILNLQMV